MTLAQRRLETRRKRIEWIRDNCPEAKDCDPYRDYSKVQEIQWKILHYSDLFPNYKHNRDCAIESLILEAQGKTRPLRRVR